MLGHAIPLTPHPHDLPDHETQQIMDDIKQREARRIPLGFAIYPSQDVNANDDT
jgi:hypothetical protein